MKKVLKFYRTFVDEFYMEAFVTNNQALENLNRNQILWHRHSASHIIVWTNSTNLKSQVENYLALAGMKAVVSKLDPKSNKTFTIYRHN